jgi:glutamate synthase (NADPH/NADH) large chain
MEARWPRCASRAEARAADNILILSDRADGPDRIAIPALLATAAVHHHLVRQGLRTTDRPGGRDRRAREVHHFCVLAGYGAEAINPYLAFETLAAHPQAQGAARALSTPRRFRRTTSRRSARAS